MKARGERITMLTAYDYTMAKILDKAASMLYWSATLSAMYSSGMIILSRLLEDMIHHTQAVSEPVNALVVADMPFILRCDINAGV